MSHCLQGHLIDTNGWITWICITVTIYSVVIMPCEGKHWEQKWKNVCIMVLSGKEAQRAFVASLAPLMHYNKKLYSMYYTVSSMAFKMIDCIVQTQNTNIQCLWNIKWPVHQNHKKHKTNFFNMFLVVLSDVSSFGSPAMLVTKVSETDIRNQLQIVSWLDGRLDVV